MCRDFEPHKPNTYLPDCSSLTNHGMIYLNHLFVDAQHVTWANIPDLGGLRKAAGSPAFPHTTTGTGTELPRYLGVSERCYLRASQGGRQLQLDVPS